MKPTVHAVTLPQVQRLDCFTLPSCTKTVTRQACRCRDWCLKLNYIETRALCYTNLVLLLSWALWKCTQVNSRLYFWCYLEQLYPGERGCTVVWNTYRIISDNKPHRKIIRWMVQYVFKSKWTQALCRAMWTYFVAQELWLWTTCKHLCGRWVQFAISPPETF